MLYPKVSSGVFAATFIAIVIAGVGSRAAQMQTSLAGQQAFPEKYLVKLPQTPVWIVVGHLWLLVTSRKIYLH
jgi:hypothetical protein